MKVLSEFWWFNLQIKLKYIFVEINQFPVVPCSAIPAILLDALLNGTGRDYASAKSARALRSLCPAMLLQPLSPGCLPLPDAHSKDAVTPIALKSARNLGVCSRFVNGREHCHR